MLRTTPATFRLVTAALAAALWTAPVASPGESEELPAGGLDARVEHFLLELPLSEEDGAEGGKVPKEPPRALASWRRSRVEAGWQLELDVYFRAERLRVYSVERLTERGTRLVFREVSPGAGRTVLAEWSEGAKALRAVEWHTGESLREHCDAGEGAVMPLYLAELARLGLFTQGSWLVFDPLARSLERQWMRTSYAAIGGEAEPGGFERMVELRREDGSLAARYVFRGERLERFQWQEGGWTARPIPAPEFEQLLAAWSFAPPRPEDL